MIIKMLVQFCIEHTKTLYHGRIEKFFCPDTAFVWLGLEYFVHSEHAFFRKMLTNRREFQRMMISLHRLENFHERTNMHILSD